MIQEKHTDQVK